MSEVVTVMQESFGQGWENHFKRFSFTPMAAASIGQVHAAITQGDRQLALKIQYPGISSEYRQRCGQRCHTVECLAAGPDGLDLHPLLQEAKRQLHQETDYLMEAAI